MNICIGKVTHYFTNLSVAVIELTGELNVGDSIQILGHITEFEQPVTSLEINHHQVQSAGPGTEVALKVLDYVRVGDMVFK